MTRRHIVLLAVGLCCSVPLILQAQSNALEATGGMFITLDDPGSAMCIGGQPSGVPWPPCSSDTKQIVWRGFTAPLYLAGVTGTGAAQVAGTIQAMGNCNLDGNYEGPCWGTFELTTAGGTWDGSWSGTLSIMAGAADLSFVGHGSGGDLEGLQLKLDAFSAGGSPYDPVPFTARVH